MGNFNFTGAEANARLRLFHNQDFELSYTAVQASPPPAGLISEYAFNYAAQSAIFAWTGDIPGRLRHQVKAHVQVAFVQKTTQTVYLLWDLSLARHTGHMRPYLRLLNLSNTNYREIPGVPLPGRSITAGAEFDWSRSHN